MINGANMSDDAQTLEQSPPVAGVADPVLEVTRNNRPTAPTRMRVALVDDEDSMHQLLQKILNKHAKSWVMDSYRDGRKALKLIPQSPPNAVLMDIAMPGITGIECVRNLKARLPGLPIIMLSAYVDNEALLDAMMAGACGCLFKPASTTEILQALEKMLSGSMTFCPRAEKTMMECFSIMGKNMVPSHLTARETEIMRCVCQEKTDKQIGEALGIGTGTVHVHMSSIFKKLNVHTRTEAMRKFARMNWAP